jgi:beta-glucosidase
VRRLALVVVVLLLPSMAMLVPARAEEFRFPPGFLWGTATAAHQVEGGNDRNDWWDWEQIPGKIKNGDRSGAADDHYNRFGSDLDLARAIHCNAYRFSIEWSRIENADGSWNVDQIDHYRQVLLACRARGITPMVTLFHFTIPRWAAALGGFESQEVMHRFVRFSAKMADELGGLVDLWCTQNEPVVYVVAGYVAGVFPPGIKDVRTAARVYANLILAHSQAYHAIRLADRVDADGDGRPAMVGIAKHLRVFDPWAAYNPADILMARSLDQIFNQVYFHACLRGSAVIRLGTRELARVAHPALKGTMDYIGVNYYSRDHVRFNPRSPMLGDLLVPRTSPVSDMGWEIYPEGFYRVLMALRRYRLPVYVTENGIADARDQVRTVFLAEHLRWMAQAMREGVDVRGYFHWSLVDNFEWAEGFWPRFGLYGVDYATQSRTLTEGGRTFRSVAGAGALRGVARP